MVRTLKQQDTHVKHNCFEEAYTISALPCEMSVDQILLSKQLPGYLTWVTRITPDCRLTSDLVLWSKCQGYQREIWNFRLSFLLEECLARQVYIRPLYVRLCVFVSKVQPVLAKHIKNLWSPVLIQRLRMTASICSYANLGKISGKVPPEIMRS